MSHLAFQSREATPRGVELEVDFVVVGSGAGGATAAHALARGGKRVALVESGAWRGPSDYPHSVYGAMRDGMDRWCTSFTRGRAFWPIVQGSAVGGSTVINSAICVHTPGDVLAQWRERTGFGEGARLLEIQQDLARELSAVEVPQGAMGRSNELALAGARAVGVEAYPMVRYARGCQGDSQCLQGCRRGRKQSLNETFIPEMLARGGVVLSCAPVERVLFEGARAVGVRGRFKHPQTRAKGAAFVVRAREGVMVAASVTHSAPLLMRSGVKLRALGEGFRAHPGTPMIGVYDTPVDMTRGATQGVASLAFREHPGFKLETINLPPDMVAGRLAGAGKLLMERLDEVPHMAVWATATRAESVGRIRAGFGGRDAVHYTLGKPDMQRLTAGLKKLAELHFAAGARAVIPCIHGLPYELGRDALHHLDDAPLEPRAYTSILSHLFGGCVMGRDARDSVCDVEGRVHGRKGLFVVDASVIPTNLGVNPQHTIMALARHFAERAVA